MSKEIGSDSTLDDEFRDQSPWLIKIDAEGSDAAIVAGGRRVTQQSRLAAVIVELANLTRDHDISDVEAHEFLIDVGFLPYTYSPFERRLMELEGYEDRTIYVRDRDFVERRLRSAPKIRILNYEI